MGRQLRQRRSQDGALRQIYHSSQDPPDVHALDPLDIRTLDPLKVQLKMATALPLSPLEVVTAPPLLALQRATASPSLAVEMVLAPLLASGNRRSYPSSSFGKVAILHHSWPCKEGVQTTIPGDLGGRGARLWLLGWQVVLGL
ncbi:UNVERIFIED_CONTAM: hypothetical protein FKN15_061241 [Acipenser sinensis]